MKLLHRIYIKVIAACEEAETKLSNPQYKMMCRVYANMFKEKLAQNGNQD